MKHKCRLSKKVLAVLLALMLAVTTLPFTVFAAGNAGSFVVSGGTENVDYTYSGGVLSITGGNVTVANADPETATTDRIYIKGVVTVTLAGVNIDTTAGAPVEIDDTSDTDVTIILENDNTLISNCANKAGIQKSRGQTGGSNTSMLTIKGDGSLTATGGSDAAGIGGGASNSSADVTNINILSGTINATGNGTGAGIGAAQGGSVWDINISGGRITANGNPGIGAEYRFGGLSDANISNGYVFANSYKGNSPTGGVVTLDSGKSYTMGGEQTLNEDITIPQDGSLTVLENSIITISPENTVTVNGTFVNNGTVIGNLINNGVIYNNGTIPENIGGTVHNKPYIEIKGGEYSGNLESGQTITITADEPENGMMFSGWTVELGNVSLFDSFESQTTFTMPDECVIIKSNYTEIAASVTLPDSTVKYYEYVDDAYFDWRESGGTLTLMSENPYLPHMMDVPKDGIIDLGGYAVELMDFPFEFESLTVQNGELLLMPHGFNVNEGSTLKLKDVTLSSEWEGEAVTITNNGQIIDLGGLVLGDGVTISGNTTQQTAKYLDENGEIKSVVITDKLTNQTTLTDGWYLVEGDVTIGSRISISGDVKIILADNSNLTANEGIDVSDSDYDISNGSPNSLSIYAQSTGENMGKLYAKGANRNPSNYYYNSAIGSAQTSAGNISIYGGNITAVGGGYAAGIGGGAYCSNMWRNRRSFGGGHITIYGGIIDSSSEYSGSSGIGIGNSPECTEYLGSTIFETSENCNAIIITHRIDSDVRDTSTWNGIIFEGSTGYVYGDNVTANINFTVENGNTLIVPEGTTLELSEGTKITNNGTIKVNNGGSYVGDQPDGNLVQYQIDWDYDGDSVADDTTYVPYGEIPSHNDISKAQTDKYYYVFTGWNPELTSVTETAVYTAQFVEKLRSFDVAIPTGEGYTIDYDGDTNIEYGSDFTFTVDIAEEYSKTDAFAVKANGSELTANSDGRYTVNVTADTQITVEGVADTTAPTATITVNENTFKDFINNITFGIFAKDKYDVTISAEDNGSGVDAIEYYVTDTAVSENDIINHSDWTSYDDAFGISNEGKYIIYAKITDKAGNITFISSDGMILEKTAPTDVVVNTNGYVSGQWTDETVKLTVSGSSAFSGIERYEYSIDAGKNWNVMSGDSLTISANTNGTEYIFRSLSNAGNYSQTSEAVVVKIDKQIPTISVIGDTNTVKQSDTVSITATAGISGNTVQVSKDGGAFETVNGNTYTVTENGTYTFKVTNGVGVTSQDAITYANIDTAKPVLSLDTNGYTEGTWATNDVVLTVRNTVNNLGSTVLEYKTDNGEWKEFNGNITVSEDTAETKYTFRATAENGLVSDEISIIVMKDETAPNGDISIDENSVKTLINKVTFGLFFNKNVDVTVTASDDTSGVKSVEYYRSENVLTDAEVNAITDWKEYQKVTETAEDAGKFVYYVKVIDNAGNASYLASNGVVFDTANPVITGVTNNEVYYTTQKVTVSDVNLEKVTVNGETAVLENNSLTLAGNVDKTYVITATDKAGNETTVSATMRPVSSLDDQFGNKTPDNITSDDKQALEDYIADLEDKLQDENITDEEKQQINDLIGNAQDLIDKIEETENAGNTENIGKVDGITPDNVKPSDKDDLITAKDDIESVLNDYANNLTDAEKAALEDKLDKIEQALDSIEKVENVETVIGSLPDSVDPDDEEAEKLIQDAKDKYDALSDYEKTLIPSETKEKLDSLLAELVDYCIIDGDGATWKLNSDGSLTITANGPLSKFTGIEVDGKAVDASNYTVVSGSTIITLKADYLNTLSVGKHTLTVLYTDGEASGTFEILANDNVSMTSPYTGNDGYMVFWTMIVFSAGVAFVSTALVSKKKKYSK